ncbi:MAG: radical SAM protein [Candidatus Omnitrophota bacterium]
MGYKRVLLINPPYRGSRVKVVFSAGLGYIAESLKYSSIVYDVIDMSLGYGYGDLKEKIGAFKPDLIGLSVMTYRYKQTYALIETLKSDFSDIDIVAGGPHISLFRQKVLEDCPALDYGVVLEGEETIVELCTGNSVDSIKGLICRKGDKIVFNGQREFMLNLDEVAFPRYEKFEMDKSFSKQINALPIVSSRGCPFDCIYCPVQFSIGQTFRMRSPENIFEELRYWHEKGYKRFSFADDNFTLKKERVYALCDLLKTKEFPGIKLSCDNGIRADKVDKDLLRYMKEVGFYKIAFGVEAGNDKVLKNLHKSESIETIKKRIQEAVDLGYDVSLFFLVGSPGETWQDLQDSFKIALGSSAGISFFYNIIPFPNTKLFEWIKENGRLLETPDDYLDYYPIADNKPLFETKEMPVKLRKKALAKAFSVMRRTMRKTWTKRLAHLGALGKLLAFLYASKFVQDIVLRNKILNKIVHKTARKVLK